MTDTATISRNTGPGAPQKPAARDGVMRSEAQRASHLSVRCGPLRLRFTQNYGAPIMLQGETRKQRVRRLVNATMIQPGRAARYLVASKPQDPSFMKALVLAQLLAWAILDQRPGRRPRNKSTESDIAVQARLELVRNALHVGNHVLALLLYRQRKLKKQDETTRILNELLEARGGRRWICLDAGIT